LRKSLVQTQELFCGETYYAIHPSGEGHKKLFHETRAVSALIWSPGSHFLYIRPPRFFFALDVEFCHRMVPTFLNKSSPMHPQDPALKSHEPQGRSVANWISVRFETLRRPARVYGFGFAARSRTACGGVKTAGVDAVEGDRGVGQRLENSPIAGAFWFPFDHLLHGEQHGIHQTVVRKYLVRGVRRAARVRCRYARFLGWTRREAEHLVMAGVHA
jgi:hypothetical protein